MKIYRIMEKQIFNNRLLILAVFGLMVNAVQAQEVTKEFRKEYSADKNTIVEINNKYGNVVISNWDNDKVEIYVKVTIELPDRSRAEKLINLIDVEFLESENRVSARTVIDQKFTFSGWGIPGRKFSINYAVKMPYYCNLELINRYGNTDIDEIRGYINLDIKYGNLTITRLTRDDEKPLNKISLSYGKGLVKEAGWLDIYLRYASLFELPTTRALLLDSRYSKIKADQISSYVGVSKYDNIQIGKINNLVLETGYTTLNVEYLEKKLQVYGSYGSVSINYVPQNFQSIDIDTRYTGVRIGIDKDANYKLKGHTSYSSIKFNEDNFVVRKRIIDNNSSEIEGIVGDEKLAQATINISSSYGSVRLY